MRNFELIKWRINEANAAILAISKHGARLFFSRMHDRVSHFYVDLHSQIWLVDNYTGMQIYPKSGLVWAGFTSDAMARKLIEALSHYIQTGKAIDAEWTAAGSTALGYDAEAMAAVRMELAHCKAVQLTETKS